MNFPSLPTDNMYKFIALFGLIIFSLSIYSNNTAFEEYIRHKLMLNSKIENHENQSKYILDARKDVRSELDDLTKRVEEGRIDSKTFKEISERLLKDYDQTERDRRIVIKEQVFINELTEQEKILEINFNAHESLNEKMFFCGFTFMLLGFILWFHLDQKYIDAEKKWKGLTFIELLKDDEAKKKSNQEELKKTKDETES